MIRLHLPGDQGLAQPKGGVDHGLGAGAGEGVGGEEDAGGLALDHVLHDHGQGHLVVVDAVALAIANGPGGPQAAPTVDDGLGQGVHTQDVEEGVLLPGEGHVRQILGGGGGAHGHGAASQQTVADRQRPAQLVRHLALSEARPDGHRGGLQGGGVVKDHPGQGGADVVVQMVLGHKGVVGKGGDHKAIGHGEVGLGQSGQVHPLAAHLGQGDIRLVQG